MNRPRNPKRLAGRSPPNNTRHESAIAALCTRYHNENAHTEQVTRLALTLFDATRVWLGLAPSDRPVLAAAARLHDLGYSVNPRHHPQVGAAIVGREGLPGFSDAQVRDITAIMPLHSDAFREALPSPRIAGLAAILRIADGLDHGHIQDATIVKVTRRGDRVRVLVRSPWFPANLARANTKADLWRAVCPLAITFRKARSSAAQRPPLLTAALPPLEAARRLLSLQFKIVVTNVPGVLAAVSSEPLHAVRVALRRGRALLRVFEKQLPARPTELIDRDLAQLARALSGARDRDVWIDYLESPPVPATIGPGPGPTRLRQYAREQRRLDQVTLRRHLQGRHFAAVRVRLGRLLRSELPQLAAATSDAPSLIGLAGKQYQRAVEKIARQARLRRSQSPEKLHQLRVTMRRARYLGEFFGALLGAPVRKQTQRIKKTEQALGRIHDLNVNLTRLAREGPPPPRALVRLLQQERQQQQQTLEHTWKRLKL